MADKRSAPITSAIPRSISNASQTAVLRHPHPAGSGRTHSRNITRLERSAEEISSQGGSDIADEIRRMSRSASIRSSSVHGHGDLPAQHNHSHNNHHQPRRMGSARGYSNGVLMTSPTGSVRSHASRTQASVQRNATGTNHSRFVMVEPLQEGRPLDSPLAPSSASVYSQEQQMSRQASQSSFSRRYDAIAHQIEESLQSIPPTPSPHKEQDEEDAYQTRGVDVPDRPHSTDTYQEAQMAFRDFDGVHFDPDREEFVEVDEEGHEIRRVSARSSSGTLMGAANMLREAHRPISYGAPPPSANMVYYPAPVPRMLNLPKRLSQQPPAHVQAKRRSQMLSEMPAGARKSAPWIPPMTFSEDGHPTQEARNSQDETKSYHSGSGSISKIDQSRGMLNERMSVANAHHLPPQLRASLFFEHHSVPHDVEVKSESAVATLDSILAASATAPVNVFTNHPYAGDVRKSVYAPEKAHQRRSTATTLATTMSDKEKAKQLKKRRSSSIGRLFRRKSTDVLAEDADDDKQSRPASRSSMLMSNDDAPRLQKRRSQLSLGGELERIDDAEQELGEETRGRERRPLTGLGFGLVDQALNAAPAAPEDRSSSRPVTAMARQITDADQIEADFKEQEEQEYDDIEDDAAFAQPTTLLAELQVRKAQLKSRNRTAATAFPGGMHSTLLQLDAVEQISAKRRQKQRIQLAWEDPQLQAQEEALRDGMDEDVPLGVLFPSKDGLVNRKFGDSRDWNRPLGLMERREMEDNEPLSNRRTRLNPNARPMKSNSSQLHLVGQPGSKEGGEEAEEDETLGQRSRRLRTKDALDGAISDVAGKDKREDAFAASVLDEFPELNIKDQEQGNAAAQTSKKGTQASAAPAAEEEETLGQRRARLQREREASGDNGASRPPLKTSNSLANLLSSNPVGQRGVLSMDQRAVPGSLLQTAGQNQLKQRQDLRALNSRTSSYNLLEKPLIDGQPQMSHGAGSGLLATERSRPANGAYAGNSWGINNPLQNTRGEVTTGLLGAQSSRPMNGAFAGGVYNTTAAGAEMPMSASNAYFASPTANMFPGGFPGASMMSPHRNQPSVVPGGHSNMMSSMPTPQSAVHPMVGMNSGSGTFTYGAQQPMVSNVGLEASVGIDQTSLDPNQRAAIDRWRMGVAQ